MSVALLLSLSLLTPLPVPPTPCPYDIDRASRIIPSQCYANATDPTATSCCWFVLAAYIYAAAAHANLTGVAFLPPSAAASCSSNFTATLLRHGLARPSLLQPNGSCSLSSDSHSPSLAAGQRPCLFGPLSSLLSAAPSQLSNATSFCSSNSVPDLFTHQSACSACQNTVIKATFSLLDSSRSKDYVACGMAATVAIWSQSYPSMQRFRSYVLCLVQVLEDVNALGIPSDSPPPPPLGSEPISGSGMAKFYHSRTVKIAALSSLAGLVSIVGIVLLALAICRSRHWRWKSRRLSDGIATTSDGEKSSSALGMVASSPLPTEGLYIFTKAELKQATDGFDIRLLLGEGGAGKVYLGKLPSGHHVAIKRIYREKKIAEFYSEVEVLAKLRHKNLTTLVGYCLDDRDNHALVYEYMPGGNLSRALFHGDLPWHKRLRIAVDVAEGLVYLHEFPGGTVVHRDVKPTNILLSESGVAKLSDFGVSRIMSSDATHLSTEVRGTMGYMDPESFSLGQVTESADVYSFGVVLLELVTGQRAVVPTPSGGAESIVHTAQCVMTERSSGDSSTAIESIMDPRLGPHWDRHTLGVVFDAAYQCVRPYKNERPRMTEVLTVLRSALVDLEAREGDTTTSDPSTEESSLSRTSTPSAHALLT
ncbi:Receptor-like protein kinase FERONIA [Rhynchospora pubera]|uniref:Receptor-like protein kinase FERONIA n=1 Tax=Rhynchospora pubera TaxID=906938 RepID=A0AAV8C3P3_9POAL|nr:Receptor-like protein kinase FERONIA [Rhynchospora pubera]